MLVKSICAPPFPRVIAPVLIIFAFAPATAVIAPEVLVPANAMVPELLKSKILLAPVRDNTAALAPPD